LNQHKVKIIAEAGVNHNGDINIAKQLIDVAADAGANYVKFQYFKADKTASKAAKKASYQSKNLNQDDADQYNMLKKLEMDYEAHKELKKYCEEKGIGCLSSPFDLEGVDELYQLGVDAFKIPSGEITNKPLLERAGSYNHPIILSTGMADLGEIEDALDVLTEAGTDKTNITVLHCNTDYPTPMEDVNLKVMHTIQEAFQVDVGYSDHTMGTEVPIAAAGLGASVIEKHFTLDRTMEGPDHKASLEPEELKAMVKAIRNVEEAMGDGIKNASASELKNKSKARKSIHLARSLKEGEKISREDLILVRPGDGVSPMEIDRVIGKRVQKDFEAYQKLSLFDIES
jgi:N-acetylneuraminate synthase/N,N'-diacetyllegionaminate synthase